MQRDHLIDYMPDVQNFEKNMSSLSDKWDLLTLLGSMSNIGMDTSETRKAFEDLLDEPLMRLTQETFNKTLDELQSKAQSAIDMLIRNLFERTADIGFLATDDDIRHYLHFLSTSDFSISEELRRIKIEKKGALAARFREYVTKYSVYENIILLDTKGKVLVQLDETNPLTVSRDPLIQESLKTHQGYVETFRSSDLTHNKPSLIYSYRVNHPQDDTPLGVLSLVFRFEDELKSIFHKLNRENPYISLEMLNSHGEVIASSAPHHVPIGANLEARNNETHLTYYAGFEYLYKALKTTGYQGYTGPGWVGHAMVPLHLAFRSSSKPALIKNGFLESVTKTTAYFPQELTDILDKAKKIQTELDITVWNGNVQIANASNNENPFTKSLLNEISKTGEETKRIFDHTVANLNTAMHIRYLEDLKFQSSLAIDIMDRNLYERANDCRWWALTTTFRKILSKPHTDDHDRESMGKLLSYINTLYTVYSTMFIYNRDGIVIAVSNPDDSSIIGKKVGYSWASDALRLETTQEYTVSYFESSPFYNHRSTYIYNACIRNFHDESVGGIGIVFDSEPQLKAMLHDILPKNETHEVKDGIFALYIDRSGCVLSSTNPSITVGTTVPLPDSLLTLACGKSDAQIILYEGLYYGVGATCANGYREYKQTNGYENDVIALLYRPIGECQTESIEKPSKRTYVYPKAAGLEETCEISTFFIGGSVFAIESKNVVCSLIHQELTTILHASEYNLGVISYEKRMVSVISLAKLLGMEKRYDKEHDTIILVKAHIHDQMVYIGLAVDAIYSSPEIPLRSISHYNNILKNENSLTKAVIIPDRAEDFGNEMISILDIPKIYTQLIQPYARPLHRVMA
ncbi:MAG: chemotaxis protein CheW [Sulfuricurvum sp.]|jgi:chemotaxis signal transduction protein|uniref:chemotaxis protein CheW n=1 Tax=Sulfuricurvum sp. TaxID=2025608 RepID=UPI0025DD752A|nr:chemotaxis protein CheW [Sulfuricurvum sp.]MCK9372482.1 chemotaxis protein CheW [Sulfuricurvum sp.]